MYAKCKIDTYTEMHEERRNKDLVSCIVVNKKGVVICFNLLF